MKNSVKLPPIIQAIISLFSKSLPKRIERLLFLNSPRIRGLRTDFKENICRMFDFLIRHMDLETGILIRKIQGSTYVPVTIEYMAKKLDVCERTVERILSLLKDVGILKSNPQRRVKITGEVFDTLFCHSCSRYLTPWFFELCGLQDLFITSKMNKPMDGIFIRSSYRKIKTKKKLRGGGGTAISSAGELVANMPLISMARKKREELPPLTPEEMIERLNRMKAMGIPVSDYSFECVRSRIK